MKYTMKKKNIASLKELIETAGELDVQMIACTMSMDVMGIRKEELIDGLEYAGVASYLLEANDAKINLFIYLEEKCSNMNIGVIILLFRN